MLSLLPALLDFGSFAPLLLRLALGGTFLYYGIREFLRPSYLPGNYGRVVGAWEALLGALLIVGLLTQIAALLIALELLGYLYLRLTNKDNMPVPLDYILVLLTISIALALLGPGLLAFDLPL